MHCPFAWLLHSRSLNNKINPRHETALRINYNDKSSFFQDLLDNSFTIHRRNIRNLAMELYKFLQGLFKNDVNAIIAFCGLFSPPCHNLSLFSLTLLPPCHRPKTNKLYFRKSNYKKLNQKHVVEEINYSSFIVDILRGHGVEDQ